MSNIKNSQAVMVRRLDMIHLYIPKTSEMATESCEHSADALGLRCLGQHAVGNVLLVDFIRM